MNNKSSATAETGPVLLSRNDGAVDESGPTAGLRWGLLGVVAFSLTVPLTRIEVADDGLSPLFTGAGRAVLAGLLAAAALMITRQPWPQAAQWLRLGILTGGIVLSFPVLTSYAMTAASASHAAVVIALLPAATAIVAVLRVKERPPWLFWTATTLGAIAAVGFAAVHGGGFSTLGLSDLLLFLAVIAAAFGYAEGGLLSRELGAWQTISWALVLGLPLVSVLTALAWIQQPPSADLAEWAAFLYLGAVSMFLGFFAWYRGLGIGPIARVSQIQLVQPVLSLLWAALLVGERLSVATIVGGAAVILCAAAAVRVRAAPSGPHDGKVQGESPAGQEAK